MFRPNIRHKAFLKVYFCKNSDDDPLGPKHVEYGEMRMF